jgi:hypothetical protein
MFAYTFGEKDPLRDHVLAQFFLSSGSDGRCEVKESNTVVYEGNMKIAAGEK